MDVFLDWLLPMNCNWFFLLIGGGLIATLVAWIWACVNYQTVVKNDTSGITMETHPVSTFLRDTIALAVTAATIFCIGWCITANNYMPEMVSEERLEIKPVVYPNGKTVQMFTSPATGYNHNANEMFRCAPPEGSYVRRVIYKRVYCGVYFPPTGGHPPSTLNDGFFLVWPDKTEKQGNLTPGQ